MTNLFHVKNRSGKLCNDLKIVHLLNFGKFIFRNFLVFKTSWHLFCKRESLHIYTVLFFLILYYLENPASPHHLIWKLFIRISEKFPNTHLFLNPLHIYSATESSVRIHERKKLDLLLFKWNEKYKSNWMDGQFIWIQPTGCSYIKWYTIVKCHKQAKITGYDFVSTGKILMKMRSHPVMGIGTGTCRSTFPTKSALLYGHILKETCHFKK